MPRRRARDIYSPTCEPQAKRPKHLCELAESDSGDEGDASSEEDELRDSPAEEGEDEREVFAPDALSSELDVDLHVRAGDGSVWNRTATFVLEPRGPVWFASKKPKAQMVERATTLQHTVHLQREVPTPQWRQDACRHDGTKPPACSREFGSYLDVSAFLDDYATLPETRRGYYECYTEDAPCRLIADYEVFVGTAPDAPPTPPLDAPPNLQEETETTQRLASFARHLAWAVKEVTGIAWSALPGCEIRSDSSRRKKVDGHEGAFWRPSVHLTHTGLVFPSGMGSQAKLWELARRHAIQEQDHDLFYRKPQNLKKKDGVVVASGGFEDDESAIDTAIYKGARVLRIVGSRKELKAGSVAKIMVPPPWGPPGGPFADAARPHPALVAASLVLVPLAPPEAATLASWDRELPDGYTTDRLFPSAPVIVADVDLDAALARHNPPVAADAPAKRNKKNKRKKTRTAVAAEGHENGRELYKSVKELAVDALQRAALLVRLPSDWTKKWGGFRECGLNAHGDVLFKAQSSYCVFQGRAHSSEGNCNSGRWTADKQHLYLKCFHGQDCYTSAISDRDRAAKLKRHGKSAFLGESGLHLTYRRPGSHLPGTADPPLPSDQHAELERGAKNPAAAVSSSRSGDNGQEGMDHEPLDDDTHNRVRAAMADEAAITREHIPREPSSQPSQGNVNYLKPAKYTFGHGNDDWTLSTRGFRDDGRTLDPRETQIMLKLPDVPERTLLGMDLGEFKQARDALATSWLYPLGVVYPELVAAGPQEIERVADEPREAAALITDPERPRFCDPYACEIPEAERAHRVHRVTLRYLAARWEPVPVLPPAAEDTPPVYTRDGVESADQLRVRTLLEDPTRSLAIRSAMGTGKTKMLLDHYFHVDTASAVLWLSTRRAYADSVAKDLVKAGFINYLDFKKENDFVRHVQLKNANNEPVRLIVSLESLAKLAGAAGPTVFGHVVCDELESLCAQFASTTLRKKRKECIELMKMHLGRARRVVALDAYLMRRGMFFLREFARQRDDETGDLGPRRDFDVVDNTPPPPGEGQQQLRRRYVLHVGPHAEQTWTLELQRFAEGVRHDREGVPRVVVPTNSKRAAQAVVELLDPGRAEGLRHYDGDATAAQRGDLKDLELAWRGCQLLVYTPIIGAGVDYNVPNHFEAMYARASAYRCGPALAFVQQTGRVRQLRSPDVHICIIEPRPPRDNKDDKGEDDEAAGLVVDKADILALFRRPGEMRASPWFQDEVLARLEWKGIGAAQWTLNEDDPYVMLHMYNVQESHMSSRNFEGELRRFLPYDATTEYEVDVVSNDDLKKAEEATKASKAQADLRRAELVAAQPSVVEMATIKELDEWHKRAEGGEAGAVALAAIAEKSGNHALIAACSLPGEARVDTEPAFHFAFFSLKARILRAYGCSTERSKVVDAEFVQAYGGIALLEQREALRELQRTDEFHGFDRELQRDEDNRVLEMAVHDTGRIGLYAGVFVLLRVLGVRLKDTRPPQKIRGDCDAVATGVPARPWVVDGEEVERRLEEEGGRALLVAMAPALKRKPFGLAVKIPTEAKDWNAATFTATLRALLKQFGLQVDSAQYGAKTNRRRRYGLVLGKSHDEAITKVLRYRETVADREAEETTATAVLARLASRRQEREAQLARDHRAVEAEKARRQRQKETADWPAKRQTMVEAKERARSEDLTRIRMGCVAEASSRRAFLACFPRSDAP